MKIAFIHLMRTSGGTFIKQCASTGITPWCAWTRGLKRDWTRAELVTLLAAKQEGIVHNHVINWDDELVVFAKENGWHTVTIVRDPLEVLPSLYRHIGGIAAFDHFLKTQLLGGMFCLGDHVISYRNWALPSWWGLIETIVPYEKNMLWAYARLDKRLALCEAVPRENVTKPCDVIHLTPHQIDAIKNSSHYFWYEAARSMSER